MPDINEIFNMTRPLGQPEITEDEKCDDCGLPIDDCTCDVAEYDSWGNYA